MRIVAHISDAHFGAHDPAIADALLDELNGGGYDVVAISGDMTQRGRVEQFEAAQAWLAQLVPTKLVVPGNHDVPLYDVVTRFLQPRDHEADLGRRAVRRGWREDLCAQQGRRAHDQAREAAGARANARPVSPIGA